jgi:hypothetical protein
MEWDLIWNGIRMVTIDLKKLKLSCLLSGRKKKKVSLLSKLYKNFKCLKKYPSWWWTYIPSFPSLLILIICLPIHIKRSITSILTNFFDITKFWAKKLKNTIGKLFCSYKRHWSFIRHNTFEWLYYTWWASYIFANHDLDPQSSFRLLTIFLQDLNHFLAQIVDNKHITSVLMYNTITQTCYYL